MKAIRPNITFLKRSRCNRAGGSLGIARGLRHYIKLSDNASMSVKEHISAVLVCPALGAFSCQPDCHVHQTPFSGRSGSCRLWQCIPTALVTKFTVFTQQYRNEKSWWISHQWDIELIQSPPVWLSGIVDMSTLRWRRYVGDLEFTMFMLHWCWSWWTSACFVVDIDNHHQLLFGLLNWHLVVYHGVSVWNFMVLCPVFHGAFS